MKNGIGQQNKPENLSKYGSLINLGFDDEPKYYWIDLLDTLGKDNKVYLLGMWDEQGAKVEEALYIKINKYERKNQYCTDSSLLKLYQGNRLLTINQKENTVVLLRIENDKRDIKGKQYWNVPVIEERDTTQYVLPIGLSYDFKICFNKLLGGKMSVSLINEYGEFEDFLYSISCNMLDEQEIIPAYLDKRNKSIFLLEPSCELKIIQ